MNPIELSHALSKNQVIISSILEDVDEGFVHFKPDVQSWSPLEVICHLVDEEREDFRTRIQHLIAFPETIPPPIDPEGWVLARKYASQDFDLKVNQWISERVASINYLKEIAECNLSIGFDHPKFGRFDIHYLLNNWLAHDLLHTRQLTRLRYQYLDAKYDGSIRYAGKW